MFRVCNSCSESARSCSESAKDDPFSSGCLCQLQCTAAIASFLCTHHVAMPMAVHGGTMADVTRARAIGKFAQPTASLSAGIQPEERDPPVRQQLISDLPAGPGPACCCQGAAASPEPSRRLLQACPPRGRRRDSDGACTHMWARGQVYEYYDLRARSATAPHNIMWMHRTARAPRPEHLYVNLRRAAACAAAAVRRRFR